VSQFFRSAAALQIQLLKLYCILCFEKYRESNFPGWSEDNQNSQSSLSRFEPGTSIIRRSFFSYIQKCCCQSYSKKQNSIGNVVGAIVLERLVVLVARITFRHLTSSSRTNGADWQTAVNSPAGGSITLTTQFHPAACPVPLAEWLIRCLHNGGSRLQHPFRYLVHRMSKVDKSGQMW
jgi:hypothetical protein